MVFSEAAEAKRDFVAFQTPMPARFLDLITNTTIKTADILVLKNLFYNIKANSPIQLCNIRRKKIVVMQ